MMRRRLFDGEVGIQINNSEYMEELDHKPEGWPAVQMRDISALYDAIDQLQIANLDLQDWFDDARATAEKSQARVAELEAVLKEARAILHEWSDYVPEYFQEKHGLERDLAVIDAVIGDE